MIKTLLETNHNSILKQVKKFLSKGISKSKLIILINSLDVLVINLEEITAYEFLKFQPLYSTFYGYSIYMRQ